MANRYWVGGTGTWNTSSTANWSTASGLSFTASCTATALTTVGSPALVAGMTVYSSTFVSLGTIVSGSGNSWVVTVGGTFGSQTMTAGTIGASVPTASDSVFFDSAPTYTVTCTGALACLDFTVSAGTVTFVTGTAPTFAVSGSLSWVAATVWTTTGAITFNATTTGKTITTNGVSIGSNISVNGAGGGWTLGSAFTSTADINLTNGTFSTGGFSISTATFTSPSGTRTLTLSSSTWTCTGSGASAWVVTAATGTYTINAGTSTVSMTSASPKTFSGGANKTYYNLDQGGAGALTIANNGMAFNDIQNSYVATNATTITIQATTLSVANFTATGAVGKVLTLNSSASGTARTLTKTGGGIISVDYMSIQDSTAAGAAASWYAGANSTNVSGNTGWIFTAPPSTGNSNFFFWQ